VIMVQHQRQEVDAAAHLYIEGRAIDEWRRHPGPVEEPASRQGGVIVGNWIRLAPPALALPQWEVPPVPLPPLALADLPRLHRGLWADGIPHARGRR
jgi:hypothetical protein